MAPGLVWAPGSRDQARANLTQGHQPAGILSDPSGYPLGMWALPRSCPHRPWADHWEAALTSDPGLGGGCAVPGPPVSGIPPMPGLFSLWAPQHLVAGIHGPS